MLIRRRPVTKPTLSSTTDRRVSATFTGVYNRQCRRASRLILPFQSDSLPLQQKRRCPKTPLGVFSWYNKCVQICLGLLSLCSLLEPSFQKILPIDYDPFVFKFDIAPIGHLQIQAHVYIYIYIWIYRLPAMVRNTDRVPRGVIISLTSGEQCELLRATITLVGDGSDGLGVIFLNFPTVLSRK